MPSNNRELGLDSVLLTLGMSNVPSHHVAGTVMVRNYDKNRVMLLGVCSGNLAQEDDEDELWEADIILVPRRKRKACTGATGADPNTYLSQGYLHPRFWPEVTFDEDEEEDGA